MQEAPLVIDNASLLGYSQDTQYFGSDIGFKKTIELSIQCISSDVSNQSGVGADSKTLFSLLEDKKDYSQLIINGTDYGNAKITSFSTESEDMVNTLSCTITFLIHQSFDDLSALTNYYADYASANIEGSLIDSFSDAVSLSSGENSTSYQRSLQIQANNSLNVDNLPDLIKSYIKDILNFGTFSFPDLTSFQQDLEYLTNSNFKKFVTETVDEISLSFNFEESLSAGNVVGNYSLVNTQNYTLSENGIATVSEDGEIIGLTSPRIDAAESGYTAELENAKNRILGIFANYNDGCADLNTDISGDPIFFTKSKTIDTFRGVIQYSLSSNNDPKYANGNGETWEYTITKEFNGTHTSANENGTVIGAGNQLYDKDGGSNLDLYPKYQSAKTYFNTYVLPDMNDRIKATSSNFCPNPISRSETHSPRRGEISYSRSFSDNPIYSLNNGIGKKVETQTSVTDSIQNKSTFVSLNPSNSRQIVQAWDTSSNLGVSNTVNIIGYRINFTDELSKMIEFGELARDQIQFIGTQNAIKYLNSCSYRFKGANDVVFSLSSNHLGGDDSCQ
jgi:hypothetical protein